MTVPVPIYSRLWFLLALFFTAPAFALDLSAVGALNFSNARSGAPLGDTTITNTYTFGTSVGGGALLGIDINSTLSVEAGALFIPREVYINNPTIGLPPVSSQTLSMLEFPVLLRFNLPFFSVGGGVYFAQAIGDITVSSSAGSSVSEPYVTADRSQTDFGLTGSAAAILPIGPISIFADARLNFGLVNLDPEIGYGFSLWDIQLLAGVRLTL